MKKSFPIAAVDIETAKYYKREDMTNIKLESLHCYNKLSDIILLSIVSIDKDLKIERKTYTYKPRGQIDLKATKIHGFDNKYFEDNDKLYQFFNKDDAHEINAIFKSMKHVYAHNQAFDYFHIC